MARISLAGFKDPVRRPRFIIWTGTIVVFLAAFVVVALGVTSSRWFCSDGCHKVQDDTIIAYQHSSHNQISCIACHIPVNADPITFLIHKVEAGLGVIPTVRNTYELPLNPEDEVALSKVKMPLEQCNQCHNLKTRKVTTSPGIIIDHEAHIKKGYNCTICHNRVAHPEDFALTLPGNKKHADFMKMDACFRCHSLSADAKAPGQCNACHPKDFNLKPDYHLEKDFYPKGHAELAKEEEAEVAKAEAAEKGKTEEEKSKAEHFEVQEVGSVEGVNTCYTCHVKAQFCDKCHGMEMPHPAEFREPANPKDPKGHPAMSKAKATSAKCEFCHHQSKTAFCDNCHHGTKISWTFNPKVEWQTQHAQAVTKNGVGGCLEKCHDTKFCQDCHNRLKPLPTSHKSPTWLHGAKQVVSDGGKPKSAKPSAQHVAAFQQAGGQEACAVCHGAGGTKASFCKSCHKLDMPHPDTFTKFHSATGKQQPATCSNCHRFSELCSNCHHVGATDANPWLGQHGQSVNKAGTASDCFAKCHKKNDCVNCHTSRKVVPVSHKASNWLHRASLKAAAGHSSSYDKSPEPCTYCHGDGGAKAKFCMNCHKIQMPHPDTFGPKAGEKPTATNGGDHAKLFQQKKANRASCNNCHTQQFCDSCHHKDGFKGKAAWGVAKVGTPQEHPAAVKANGTAGCFECHKETYCSYCHVRAAR